MMQQSPYVLHHAEEPGLILYAEVNEHRLGDERRLLLTDLFMYLKNCGPKPNLETIAPSALVGTLGKGSPLQAPQQVKDIETYRKRTTANDREKARWSARATTTATTLDTTTDTNT